MTAYKRILVIMNPVSGQHDPDETEKLIGETLEPKGVSFEVRRTEGEGDALKWAQGAEAEGFDLVLATGGDGTIMETMSGLIKGKSSLPLAQLPVGTASLLARSLGIPTDKEGALELIFSGKPERLDVGYLPDYDRYFAIVAGAGWDARLIEDAPRTLKRHLGFVAYVLTGVKNLFTLRRTNITLTIDGETQKFRAHTIMVANVGEIKNAGLALGPGIHPHDGKLDLIVVASQSVWGIMTLMYRLVRRDFCNHRGLQYHKATTLTIDAHPPLPIQIDGEAIGETPLRAEVVPKGALIIVPQDYNSMLEPEEGAEITTQAA